MNNTPSAELQPPVSRDDCGSEPIHLLGQIQPFGFLLAVSSEWTIAYASENSETYLGQKVSEILGKPIGDFIADGLTHELRNAVQMIAGPDSAERLFNIQLLKDDPTLFDIAVHFVHQLIVLEAEPAKPGKAKDKDYNRYIRPLLDRVKRAATIEDACQTAARNIKAITGFDRVMVYRFAHDGSGEVIAEAREPDIETFMGLHYPASDIPKQARALYKRNLLRIISDVDSANPKILGFDQYAQQPLDLSLSSLRAVADIHIQYLKNMGVAASMSMSIIVRGELWGLIACHNYKPLVLDYRLRTTLELMAEMFSFVIEQRVMEKIAADDRRARELHDEMRRDIARGNGTAEAMNRAAQALASVIPIDGYAVTFDETIFIDGKAPNKTEIEKLRGDLNNHPATDVLVTDELQTISPDLASNSAHAAGLMALSVSKSPRDYLMLFRQEVIQSVSWAGNPDKAVSAGPDGNRLTPRESFEVWKQTVKGKSYPWTDSECRIANSFRNTLLEVSLHLTSEAERERKRQQEYQELLIAELNHRVRNILGLIRGLVSQSRDMAAAGADLAEIIGGRVEALARAHNQVTQKVDGLSSLHDLIEAESSAYIAGQDPRLHINGIDVLLTADAFTTVSLTIHELVTNAMKYGALSNKDGKVAITIGRDTDDNVELLWAELNGPEVKEPTRQGFGTTIINRSIPFELQGEAEVNFSADGLKGRFLIPARFAAGVDRHSQNGRAKKKQDETDAPALKFSGKCLVVEDNLFIALETEAILAGSGFEEVIVASTVPEALGILNEQKPDCAVVDVNLGTESSALVTSYLHEQNIPFVVVTGYGESEQMKELAGKFPIVQKPYSPKGLLSALAKVIN